MPRSSSVTAHPDYDPAIPARQAADYLSIHYKTLLALTRRRKIAVIRTTGGRLSYRLSVLNDYLDSLTEDPRSSGATSEINWADL